MDSMGMHKSDLPEKYTAEELVYNKGCNMGYFVKPDGSKTILLLPDRYKETMIAPSTLKTATKSIFPDVTAYDTDLGGWTNSYAPQFLSPQQGLPWDTDIQEQIGKNLIWIPNSWNNNRRKVDQTPSLKELIKNALTLLDSDEERTLTLVIPTATPNVSVETYLRTEQRRFFSDLLPYIKGIAHIQGDIYTREWRMKDTEFECLKPQITNKKWVAIGLQGTKRKINEDLRNQIVLKELPPQHNPAADECPEVIDIASEPTTEVYIEASWTDSQNYRDQQQNGDMWTELLEHFPELDEVTPYGGGYATRPDAFRYGTTMPRSDARDLVTRLNERTTFDRTSGRIEMYCWIDEQVHSTDAVAMTTPTNFNTSTAHRYAVRFMTYLADKTGKKLSLVPGRYYETLKQQYFPKRRYYHITGITPKETARALADPTIAQEMARDNVTLYNHRGVTIKLAGNVATFTLAANLPVEAVLTTIAETHNLTIQKAFPTPSRDNTQQRVRVLFDAGDRLTVLGRSIPVRYGKRTYEVQVYTPQHRQTADALSNATSAAGTLPTFQQDPGTAQEQEQRRQQCSQQVLQAWMATRATQPSPPASRAATPTPAQDPMDADTEQQGGTGNQQQAAAAAAPAPQQQTANRRLIGGPFEAFAHMHSPPRRAEEKHKKVRPNTPGDEARDKTNTAGSTRM